METSDFWCLSLTESHGATKGSMTIEGISNQADSPPSYHIMVVVLGELLFVLPVSATMSSLHADNSTVLLSAITVSSDEMTGDLGRSPRMQYHVLSLLQAGHFVTFVGYTGESLIPSLLSYAPKSLSGGKKSDKRPTLQVIRFPAPKVDILRSIRVLLPLYFVWRAISLFFLLIVALSFVKPTTLPSTGQQVRPQAVLIQNPPAIPILLVMMIYKYWTGARLIIDWHNLYVYSETFSPFDFFGLVLTLTVVVVCS